MDEKIIFHIDVNSAFLSWEATYRTALGIDDVDLRTIPSIVGGDIEKRHGIVLAKSIPAKKFGIKTGEPIVSALKKCPSLKVVQPQHNLYLRASKRFVQLLKEFTPLVEQYSVDECFMDCTHAVKRFENPIQMADMIRKRVREQLGFTVNIGISGNKLLAKMASEFEKPDKTHTLFRDEIEEKMWPLDVSELFMVGRKTSVALKKIGIHTIGQLATAEQAILIKYFKNSRGIMLHHFANGIDDSSIKTHSRQAKSVGNSTTLPADIKEENEALLVILSLCERVSGRLRTKKLIGNVISISIKNFGFHSYSCQKKIALPTNNTNVLYNTCVTLFRDIWKGEPIRLLGVSVSALCSSEIYQTSFFDQINNERVSIIDTTIDTLRSIYGQNSIVRASFLNSNHKPIKGGIGDEPDFPAMHSYL